MKTPRQKPCVFFLPGTPRKELGGLLPELLVQGITGSHLATEESVPLEKILEGYRDLVRLHGPQDDFLYGEGESAGVLFKDYYKFLNINPPAGIILIEPEIDVVHLNQLACPFLLVHAPDHPEMWPLMNAIKHHVYRYGDPTDHLQLDTKELPNKIVHWIRKVEAYRNDPGHWSEKLNAAV